MCVRLMLPGEIALVTCPPDYAYDKFERLGGRKLGLVLLPFLGALDLKSDHHEHVFSDENSPLIIAFYNSFFMCSGQLMFLKVLTYSGKLSFLTLTHRR